MKLKMIPAAVSLDVHSVSAPQPLNRNRLEHLETLLCPEMTAD